jgi:RNA polymerase sigma factor (sigma-70 family)
MCESEAFHPALSVEEPNVTGPWQRMLEMIRRRADPDATGPTADERLLGRFVANGDPSAFELMVWRHGTLVYGTCRRILGDVHSSEDAFQATFLALARKPHAVRSGAALAGWLHRVAVRIANKLRVSMARQNAVERAAARELATASDEPRSSEIATVLDDEIDRLPDRLRRAVVLCYLDGRTTEQAAAVLGCPRGTVLSRLSAARDRLRIRLTRRGMTLPVSGISALVFSAETTATLVPRAVHAALTHSSPILIGLVQGVFHAMFMTKVKIATAVVMTLGIAGAGIGWVAVPGSGPAVVQADEVKGQAPQKVVNLNAQAILDDAYERANKQTTELLREAQRILKQDLVQAEEAWTEFRLKNPHLIFTPKDNRRSKIEPIEAKQMELALRRIEIETRLEFLREAAKESTDISAKDKAAALALLKLELRGVDIKAISDAANRKHREFFDDSKEGLNTFVVRLYIDALESELRDIERTRSALSDLQDREIKSARDLMHLELMDDRLRNAVTQQRQLLDTINKRLAELTLLREPKK